MGPQLLSLQSLKQLLNAGNLSPRLATAWSVKRSDNTTDVSGIFMAGETRREAHIKAYEGGASVHMQVPGGMSWLTIFAWEERV